jgi:hypothetical protein
MDEGNLRNYGRMVIELASTVPDGLVVFFVSYSYMDYVIAHWHQDGLLAELINHKLIFIETQVCLGLTACCHRVRAMACCMVPTRLRNCQVSFKALIPGFRSAVMCAPLDSKGAGPGPPMSTGANFLCVPPPPGA